jgi:hypothetical protein
MGEQQVRKKKVRRGPKLGPRLTKKDHAILKQIALKGFQTFLELRAGSLNTSNRTHAWDSMKKLVNMGHVQEVRGDTDITLGWSLTPKGQERVSTLVDLTTSSNRHPPMYRTSFEHDLLMRKVEDIFRKFPAVSSWTPEYVVRGDVMAKFKRFSHQERMEKLLTIPDALFEFCVDNQVYKAALELELTRKTKRRLFKKFESHITSSEFGYVFFVAENEKLLSLLWRIYNQVSSQSSKVKYRRHLNGIYFIELKNLLDHGIHAKFQGPEDTLSFSEFMA